MAKMIKFHPVTGECRCCGGNQFIFDEKEQTFVCEHCGTEVYSISEEDDEPVKEEKTEPKKADISHLPDVEQIFPPFDTDYIKILGVFAVLIMFLAFLVIW